MLGFYWGAWVTLVFRFTYETQYLTSLDVLAGKDLPFKTISASLSPLG